MGVGTTAVMCPLSQLLNLPKSLGPRGPGAGGTLRRVSTPSRVNSAPASASTPRPSATLGIVTKLMRYPFKSFSGEQLSVADVSEDGLLGDRVFGIVDTSNDELLSLKTVPLLRAARAYFREDGEAMVLLPDGSAFSTDDHNADQLLSDWLHRRVRVERATASPGRLVGGKPPFRTATGSFLDTQAAVVIGTTEECNEHALRANVVVEPGTELHWQPTAMPGRVVDIGGVQVRLLAGGGRRWLSGPPIGCFATVVGVGRVRPGDEVSTPRL